MKRDIIASWDRYTELDSEQALLITQRDQLTKQIKELQKRKIVVLDLFINSCKPIHERQNS